jgi:hypothetical protein
MLKDIVRGRVARQRRRQVVQGLLHLADPALREREVVLPAGVAGIRPMTMGEVRLDTAKAARFSASALSTGAFDALLPARSTFTVAQGARSGDHRRN